MTFNRDLENFNDIYDILYFDCGISEEALDLAFALKGSTKETAEEILDWRTGYKSFEQYLEDLEEE